MVYFLSALVVYFYSALDNQCPQRKIDVIPHLSDVDLIKSAKDRRKARNEVGSLFREIHLDTLRRRLEELGPDDDLIEPIEKDE